MFLVEDILKFKGSEVWTVAPDVPMQTALALMAEKNIGALVVSQADKVLGVFSERDLARRIIDKDSCSLVTKVKDLMTSPAVTVKRTTTVEECMNVMTEKHFRHLPVVEDDHLVGLISIGDVIKAVLTSQEETIGKLQDYISGTDYGH